MNATIDTTTLKESINLQALASRSTKLRKVASNEFAGPCPHCGGVDRFHVHGPLFMCRRCHPNWGDAIEFVRWLNACTFTEAIKMLDANAMPTISAPPVNVRQPPQRSQPDWQAQDVLSRLAAYQQAMDDSPATDYLASRGLCPDTWHAYRMGYDAQRNALAMPWYRGGTLIGVNYRRLDAADKGRRFLSETGSLRTGVLYGAQALAPNLHHLLPNGSDPLARRSLFIVEGELNCASIYQAAYGARVDVLSTGAESNTIPDSFIPIAVRYRACVVWKDKSVLARAEAKRIPGAAAYWSENDGYEVDANDHLQQGTLGALVAHVLRQATPTDGQQALAYDLQDARLG
jgi:hypothetical protein